MSYVAGLDLSLTSTGVALVSDTGKAAVQRVRSKGKRADSLVLRGQRLDQLYNDTMNIVAGPGRRPALVVLERQIGGQMSGSTHDRSGLWWMIVGALVRGGVPVVDVVPQHVKLYALGKGSGAGTDKDEVLAATIKRYAGVVDVRGNDEADALLLADLGARHLGFPLPGVMPARNLEAVQRTTWPS